MYKIWSPVVNATTARGRSRKSCRTLVYIHFTFSTAIHKHGANLLVVDECCKVWHPWLRKEVITEMHIKTEGICVSSTGFNSYAEKETLGRAAFITLSFFHWTVQYWVKYTFTSESVDRELIPSMISTWTLAILHTVWLSDSIGSRLLVPSWVATCFKLQMPHNLASRLSVISEDIFRR